MFEKRQFTDSYSAEQYAQQLKARGFAEANVKPENGKYYVYYKRY